MKASAMRTCQASMKSIIDDDRINDLGQSDYALGPFI